MQRVGDHNFNRFGVNAHSSHRFGLSVRSAPALTCRLPFPPGCVLRLRLLDFKAVIFPSHKLLSRLLAHHRRFKRGAESIGAWFRGFRETWDLVHFIRHLPNMMDEEVAQMKN